MPDQEIEAKQYQGYTMLDHQISIKRGDVHVCSVVLVSLKSRETGKTRLDYPVDTPYRVRTNKIPRAN